DGVLDGYRRHLTRLSVISPRAADDVLDLLQRFRPLLRPARLVVGEKLDLFQRRHAARQLGKIEILTRGPAEELAHDLLAHWLRDDVVDKFLRRLGVRAAADDADAFHLRDRAVLRIDDLDRRAARRPLQPG